MGSQALVAVNCSRIARLVRERGWKDYRLESASMASEGLFLSGSSILGKKGYA